MNIELVTIGTELLLGMTIDTNGAEIARALAAHGVRVTRRTSVADGAEEEAGQPLEESLGLAGPTADASLTLAGKTMGTPYYMSPEQVEGKAEEIDCRSDLYSLGATLFHMLAGRAPFSGSTSVEIMQARISGKPLPLRKLAPKVSPATERIVSRLLQKDKAQRFQTPEELADALAALLDEFERGASSPPVTQKSASPNSEAAREVPKARRKARPNPVVRAAGIFMLATITLALVVGGALVLVSARSGGPHSPASAKEHSAPSEDPVKVMRQTPPLAETPRPVRVDPVVEKPPALPVDPPAKNHAQALPLDAPLVPPPEKSAPTDEPGKESGVPAPLEKPPEALAPPPEPASARWAEEVLGAVRKGAEYLTDGREFNLETLVGDHIQVGGKSTSKALGVGDQEIKVRSFMGDRNFNTPIPFKSLTPPTRLKLALLAPLPPADTAALKAKWAFVEMTALEAGPAPESMSEIVQALERCLAEAKAAGAPEVLLRECQPLLDRARVRFPSMASKTEPLPGKPPHENKRAPQETKTESEKSFTLRQARVGDWVEWRQESWLPLGATVVRQAVLSKKENKAMVTRDQTGKGSRSASTRQFDLDASYRPDLPGFIDLEIFGTPQALWKITEGEETLQIAGKAYPCHWKHTVLQKGNLERKVWTSPDVPLGGIVKIEDVNVGRKSTTLLTRCERGAGE